MLIIIINLFDFEIEKINMTHLLFHITCRFPPLNISAYTMASEKSLQPLRRFHPNNTCINTVSEEIEVQVEVELEPEVETRKRRIRIRSN